MKTRYLPLLSFAALALAAAPVSASELTKSDVEAIVKETISKNPDLVRPFATRGYQPGMRPNLEGYAQGLETFLPNFLVDFSTERTLESPPK